MPTSVLTDGYDGPPVGPMINLYSTLHIDPAAENGPIPTNKWWTNLMISPVSTNGVWSNASYQQSVWLYPGIMKPTATGMNLTFPKAWQPRPANNPYQPLGQMDAGIYSNLEVDGFCKISPQSGDVLLADFESPTWPSGWTATGDFTKFGPQLGGSFPGQSPGVSGFEGSYCLNSFYNGNAGMGSLTSPTFTIQDNYIDFLVGGGNDSVNEVVQLVVGGNVVFSATGQNSAQLNWVQWNVTAYKGQNAQIVIKDSSAGGWGFILCDYIIETNNAAAPGTIYNTNFTTASPTILDWGDWNLDYYQADGNGNRIDTGCARGIPFIWQRYSANVVPNIRVLASSTLYDVNQNAINTSSGSFVSSAFSVTFTDSAGNTHCFGVFAPTNTTFIAAGDFVRPSAGTSFMVFGYLPDKSYLAQFAQYAYARVTGTQMTWTHDIPGGNINTTWTINTTPLQGTNTQTIQGWLPHHYHTAVNNLTLQPFTYLTPRGTLKMTIGNTAQITWPFKGISPAMPAPHTNGLTNDYDATRMAKFMNLAAAEHPGETEETYNGARELAFTSQLLAADAQLGYVQPFADMQSGLRQQLADWLTYTPGETTRFFARYPNWRATIGIGPTFGVQAFNDQHFHYGYFAVATALLGMQDPGFLWQYGPMMRQVVKEYANWDRNDTNYPYLRTFDVWEGHSGAGGTGDYQGENQESSSESMNSWAGMYMLGALMGDTPMQDAGAMGYAIESSAVNEYWQDWQGTNFPPASIYGAEGAGIVSNSAVTYGDYFFNDPAWFDGIQWVATNTWNNYLVRNPTVAQNQFTRMFQSRQYWSDHAIGGYALDTNFPNTVIGIGIANDPNMKQASGDGLASAIQGFELMFDPNTVAADMDTEYAANDAMVTDPADYYAYNYYLTHTFRAIGLQDLNYTTSIPTSEVFFNSSTGVRTYVIYNPSPTAQTATVYNNGSAVGTIVVPGRQLVATTSFGGAAASTPYFGLPASIPGKIEAENFDNGGNGLGYQSNNNTNTSGQYRPSEGVSIEAIPGGGYDVNNTAAGQWMQYTVQVAKSGQYTFNFKVSATAAATFHITDNGTTLTTVNVPNTGGTQNWTTITQTIAMTSGNHTLRLVEDSGNFTIDYIQTVATPSTSSVPIGATINMKSVANYFFVSADQPGGANLIANRNAASTWEEFQVIDAGGGNIALKSLDNNQYVTAASATTALIPNSTTIGVPQQFQWIDLGSNFTVFKSVQTGLYVTVDAATKNLFASQSTYGPNETFLCGIVVPSNLPASPSGLTATGNAGSISLSWLAASGATSYNVYRGTTAGGEGTTPIATGLTGTSYTDTAVTAGTTYYYTVASVNASGTSGMSNEASAAAGQSLPSTPTGVSATAANSQVTVSWNASTGATSYNLYRSTTSGGEGTTPYKTGVTSPYADTGLMNGTTYYYTVAAVNAAGTSAQSTEVSGTPQSGVPAAPTGVSATAGNAQATISWSASSGATSYNVYRSTTSGGEGTTPYKTSVTSPFSDTGLTNGTTYYYTVAAVNASGTSPQSTQVSAQAQTTVISINCGGTATGSWVADTDFSGGTPNTVNATVDTSLISAPVPPQAVFDTNRFGAFTYTIPNLTAGNAYTVTLYFAETYWTAAGKREFNLTINGTQVLTNFDIFATAGAANKGVQEVFNTTANSSGQIVITTTNVIDNGQINGIMITTGGSGGGTQPPATPSGLAVSSGNAQLTVSWNASSGATSYNLYRSTTTGGEGTTPYKTNVTSPFTDTGLTNGTTYYYTVAAVNSAGTSTQSTEASGVPQAGPAVAINCGGAAVGNWVADTDFSGGTATSVTNTIDTSLLTSPVPPQAVLQSNRYGAMTYTIPGFTAGSSHTVTLYFAETYFTAAGQRTFNVSINGTTELSNFDIFAAAGAANKGVQKSFTINANSSGQYVISFTLGINQPQINGITVN